jgi:hypothetical protein
MRGLGNVFKGAVFIAGLVGVSGAAFAQQDPQIVPSFSNVVVNGNPLDQVTLSRDGELATFAAYDIALTNKTTNALSRLYFTAKVKTVGSTDGSYATFDTDAATQVPKLYLTPSSNTNSFNCGTPTVTSSTGSSTAFDTVELTCTSSISLPFGVQADGTYPTQKVTIPVKAPTSGSRLEATFSIGGYEGNSQTGQGCCAYPGSATTTLVDYTQDGTLTYTTQATTFVKGDTGGRVYTGTKALPGINDLFTTNIDVAANFGAMYDIATITEKSIPDGTGRCKQSKLKICHETTISLPNVLYAKPWGTETDASGVCPDPSTGMTTYTGPLLDITLRISFSSIKGNPLNLDLTAIRLSYDETGEATKKDAYGQAVYDCSSTSGFPCICGRRSDSAGKYVEFYLRNYKNGRLTAW